MTGIELDPTTARIAALLYPGGHRPLGVVRRHTCPRGVFDAVIGNVPATCGCTPHRHRPPGADGWTRTRDVGVAGRTMRINPHLADHPTGSWANWGSPTACTGRTP